MSEEMKELTYDGKKVVSEVARRDAQGNTIDTTYVKLSSVLSGGDSYIDWISIDGDEIEIEFTDWKTGIISYEYITLPKFYNHFIYMTIQNKSVSYETLTFRFNFVSRNATAITTLAQLKTYLGVNFRVSVNGIGNYNQVNGVCYCLAPNYLYFYGFDGGQTAQYSINYTSTTYSYTITDSVQECLS